MSYSQLPLLPVSTWINSPDPLLSCYRDYLAKGKVSSKANLALAATIHTVKTVAYACISAVGIVLYCVTLGCYQNRSWSTCLLQAEMTKASILALFNFKSVMDKLQVAEAKAYYQEPLNPKQLLNKLKGLTDTQLVEALPLKQSQEGEKLVNVLYRLRKECPESQQKFIDTQLSEIQKRFYQQQMIICYSKETGKALFINAAKKQGLEAGWPELKAGIEKIDQTKGGTALALTPEQYAFCAGTIEDPKQLTPSLLEKMAKAAVQEAWKDNLGKVKKSCETYATACLSEKKTLSKEEIAALREAARLVDSDELSTACLLMQVYDPTQEAEAIQALQAWPKDKEHCVASTLRKIPQSFDVGAKLIELCLSSANIDFLKMMSRSVNGSFGPKQGDRLKQAWETCPDANMKHAAMPLLYSMASSHCPKLAAAIYAQALLPATLAASKENCVAVLFKCLGNHELNHDFKRANIGLRDKVLEILAFARQENLDSLRDECVKIIMKNAKQYPGIWLGEQSDLIANALRDTKYRADYNNYDIESVKACAAEGFALVQYAQNNAASPYVAIYKAYIRNNPAYLTAVQRLPTKEQTPYQALVAYYN